MNDLKPIFKKGDYVKWKDARGIDGNGRIVMEDTAFDEPVPHYLVIVNKGPGMEHPVIYCAETWLTKVEA